MLRDLLLAGCGVVFAATAIAAAIYLGTRTLHETTERAPRARRRFKAPKENPPTPLHVPIVGANEYRYFSTSASDRVYDFLRRGRKARKKN